MKYPFILIVCLGVGLAASAEEHQKTTATAEPQTGRAVGTVKCGDQLRTCQEERAELAKRLKSLSYVCIGMCRINTAPPFPHREYRLVTTHHEYQAVAFSELENTCGRLARDLRGVSWSLVSFRDGNSSWEATGDVHCMRQ